MSKKFTLTVFYHFCSVCTSDCCSHSLAISSWQLLEDQAGVKEMILDFSSLVYRVGEEDPPSQLHVCHNIGAQLAA